MQSLTVKAVMDYLRSIPSDTVVIVQWTDANGNTVTPAHTCVEYDSEAEVVVFKEFVGDPQGDSPA